MAEFDWPGAYARLDRARRTLESASEHTPEEVRKILAGRAERLAQPLDVIQASTEELELLVLSLGGERYAVETSYVLEVIPLRGLTPVPCTPSFVLGLVNHRGRVLPVLDLRRLFDPGAGLVAQEGRVVAVQAAGMAFGIFADAIGGTFSIPAEGLAPPPTSVATDHQGFLRGVTPDMIAVMDVDGLARARRITVNEGT